MPSSRSEHISEGALPVQIGICLYGFGNVGREFVRVLVAKSGYLKSRHQIEVILQSIVTSKGGIVRPEGFGAGELLRLAAEGRLREHPEFCEHSPEQLERWVPRNAGGDMPRVIVDATWSDLATGAPGLSRLRRACELGCHIITLNKAPLVADFDGLVAAARENSVQLKFSGATAAGLPTIDTIRVSLAGAEVTSIEGIMNSTTNYILTAMSDEGLSYEDALNRTVAMGLAESETNRDVAGIDTACKVLILANAAMNAGKKLSDVKINGIADITRRDIARWAMEGRSVKLVGKAVRQNGDVVIEVGPAAIPHRDFFAQVREDAKAVKFTTDLFGELTMVGGSGGLTAAAGSALRDLVNLAGALRP